MDDWLAHPAVQAGLVPFVTAFIVGLAHRRLAAWAIAAALLSAAALTVGFSLESLTAARKLVIVTSLAALLAPASNGVRLRVAVAALLAFAIMWVLWRVLQARELAAALAIAVGAVAYLGALTQPSLVLAGTRSCVAAALLAFGGAALSLLGASVVFAQLCIAVGVAALALIGARFVRPGVDTTAVTLPAALFAGGAAVLSVLTGELAPVWLFALLPLPWLARLRLPSFQRHPMETQS